MLPIALALASLAGHLAPTIAGWLGGSKAQDVATQVVNTAMTLTGQSSGDAALAAIQADPNLAMQWQKAMIDSQTQLAQIAGDVTKAELSADQANTATINQTMQAEAKSDHWPTYSWRPFVGFCFAVAWLGDYLVLPILHGYNAAIVVPTVPPEAWMAIGAVLGVASYFRGRMQADPRVPSDQRG